MGRLALIVLMCVPLMAQDVRLQAALQDHYDPEMQKALEHAQARAGIWVASMSQSQQLLFSPAIIRGISLNIELQVSHKEDCVRTNDSSGQSPVMTCGPSSIETVVQGVDFDLAGDLIINPDGSPEPMGPEWQSMLGSQTIRVPEMALSGDQLHFSGTWEKPDCCALFPTRVPIAVDAKFSPDGSQLTGTMTCDGKSESVTFERAENSGTPFGGDWISQDGLVFHIHNSAWGGTHIAASFDQISSGLFGMPVETDVHGAKLYLTLSGPTTISMFIGDISADGSSMTGYWGGNSPGSNNFSRLTPTPAPQK